MNNETPATEARNPQPATIRRDPKKFARKCRLRNMGKRNVDGTFKGTGNRQMMQIWNDQAIYTPRRKKLKGYEKERKRRYGHIKAA
jgi:hypothetical protein